MRGTSATRTLVSGVLSGLGALSSILFMLFIGSVIFLFMLLHGARYQAWVVRHSGLSLGTIEPVVHDSASAIRGYFKGTTILAVTNAVPVGITAWLLGIPLVGAIALVTFITAYVPFYGAIIAGLFACLIALGSQGLTTALIMLAVLLLVNNVLQNFFAPFAYGSSLQLDPLVVLLVTTGAGLIGGVPLIVLAAPLTAIITRAAARLAAAREAAVAPVVPPTEATGTTAERLSGRRGAPRPTGRRSPRTPKPGTAAPPRAGSRRPPTDTPQADIRGWRASVASRRNAARWSSWRS